MSASTIPYNMYALYYSLQYKNYGLMTVKCRDEVIQLFFRLSSVQLLIYPDAYLSTG